MLTLFVEYSSKGHTVLHGVTLLAMIRAVLGISMILLRGQSINMRQKDDMVFNPLLQ